MSRRVAGLLALVVVALAACGGRAAGPFPDDAVLVAANADLAVGPSRLLLGVATPDGRRLGGPDVPVDVVVVPPGDSDARQRVEATFLPIVPDVVGIYRALVDFDLPGIWTVELLPRSGGSPLTTVVEVKERPFTVPVGAPAPATPTATIDDRPLEALTTDPEPDPRLYERSLAEAVGNGRPTVVVFATPAFCTTAACGPMLRQVKAEIDDHPDVDFVHVEVYEGFDEPGFVPDAGHLAPAVVDWGLPSEPWVFVVAADGTVAARLEGTLGPGELAEILDRIR